MWFDGLKLFMVLIEKKAATRAAFLIFLKLQIIQ